MGDIRVLHVDDSVVIRGIIRRFLSEDPDIVMLPQAKNGIEAIEFYKAEKPDIVIMDIEMPEMNGMDALEKIIEFDPKAKVMMCSTLTKDNAAFTMKAMKIGAIDYVAKPSNDSRVGGAGDFKKSLIHKLRAIVHPEKPVVQGVDTKPHRPIFTDESQVTLSALPPTHWHPKVMAIGSSTGGPNALIEFMKGVAKLDLKIPIAITQHMPPTFTTLLAKNIADQTGIPCHEAEDGMIFNPGEAILARGGHHMEFKKDDDGVVRVALSDGPDENFCKPAVDPMVRSLMSIYGGHILGVILTGMGYDGQKSMENLVNDGGYCIAQDKQSSVVWGMPGAVASVGVCSVLLPPEKLPEWIQDKVNLNSFGL